MSEQKTPASGEWWFSADMKVRGYIIGADLDGMLCYRDGAQTVIRFVWPNAFKDWHHEPACDSWDWQPETFPQWIIRKPPEEFNRGGYVMRTPRTEAVQVCGNGDRLNVAWDEYRDIHMKRGDWIAVTREQAEALVVKPESEPPIVLRRWDNPNGTHEYQMLRDDIDRKSSGWNKTEVTEVTNPAPVESPDDWVTQDRVPARPKKDEYRWVVTATGIPTYDWTPCPIGGYMHGQIQGDHTRELRCRRKDLPPLPAYDPAADPNIGTVPLPEPVCNGCGKPLKPEHAWMEDGCPCNSPAGVNEPTCAYKKFTDPCPNPRMPGRLCCEKHEQVIDRIYGNVKPEPEKPKTRKVVLRKSFPES